jgi:hypothetical protein
VRPLPALALPSVLARYLPAALALLLLASPARPHDGSKFEPPDGKVLHGAGQDAEAFDNYTLALGDPGLEPAVTKEYYGIWDRWPRQWLLGHITWEQLLEKHVLPLQTWLAGQHGRMPEVSLDYRKYQDEKGDRIIVTGVLDPVIVEAALAIKAFGEPCFVRPGFEPHADEYTEGLYISAFRRVVDIFRALRVDNAAFIFCAGPSSGVIVAQENLWYPGDSYVDWVGLDLFTAQEMLPLPGSPLPYPDSLYVLLELAEGWRKPVILSETSALMPGGITDPSAAAAEAYWATWFAPFFQLLRDNPRIKAFCYIDWNWPLEGYPLWADARIENNAFLAARLATELSDARYLHRATGSKLPRPWLVDLHQSVAEGEHVSLRIANSGPAATVQIFLSLGLIQSAPNAGYLDYTKGFLHDGQYWFLDGPLTALPEFTTLADGTFELDYLVPPGVGLTGFTVYAQAVVRRASGNSPRLTQPFELVLD